MSERPKRYVVSLNPEMEELISQIQQMLQKQVPPQLGRVKVSKSVAVEMAIKSFLEKS